MINVTVGLKNEAHRLLKRIAKRDGRSMQKVLEPVVLEFIYDYMLTLPQDEKKRDKKRDKGEKTND